MISFQSSFIYGSYPASFSFIFGLFKQTNSTILQQINVKKCPSDIRYPVFSQVQYLHLLSPTYFQHFEKGLLPLPLGRYLRMSQL